MHEPIADASAHAAYAVAFGREPWSSARRHFALTGILRETATTRVMSGLDRHSKPIVVKFIDEARADRDAFALPRFAREATIAARIRHPSIARCLGQGSDWIAFEYVNEGLVDSVRRGGFAVSSRIRALVGQIAAVLAHIHACGIVHCDVKPAHIRLRAGRPVLIDFGVAGLVADDPLGGCEQVGTPAWMSPEQLAGAQAGPAADVWSLCAIGAWLLAGAPDISGTAEEALAARASGWHPGSECSLLATSDAELAAILLEGLDSRHARPPAAAIARRLAANQ